MDELAEAEVLVGAGGLNVVYLITEFKVDFEFLFEIKNPFYLTFFKKEDIKSRLSLSRSSSRPMNETIIILACDLNNDIYVIDIDTPSSHISSNQNEFWPWLSEFVKSMLSLPLFEITMDG